MLQFAVFCQQKQAFAITIKSAGGVVARRIDEVGKRLPAILIGELAQDIEGFVEKKDSRRLRWLAFHKTLFHDLLYSRKAGSNSCRILFSKAQGEQLFGHDFR